jgi:hypothetical protein
MRTPCQVNAAECFAFRLLLRLNQTRRLVEAAYLLVTAPDLMRVLIYNLKHIIT